MAHKGFAKVGKWKQVSFEDADIDLGQAGELGMLEEIFGDNPEELFLLSGKLKHADLSIKVIGDQAGVYVIDGDLTVTGTLTYNQIDGGSALYVTGKLTCGNLALGPEANLWVGKDLAVKGCVLGFLGDAGSIIVGGTTTADTWIERYGRGTKQFKKKPKLKSFVRWDDEELESFPKVTLAEVALVDAFVDSDKGNFDTLSKALAKKKPVLVSPAERKKRETALKKAEKEKEAAAGATAELDIVEKDVKAIPAAVFKKPLRKLAIGGHNLKTVPADIRKITTLQELAIKHNYHIKVLPAAVGELPNLHTLVLDKATSITDLPASLVKKNALRALTWGPIDKLPAAVAKLTNLEKLYLYGESSCRMTAFPTEITKLTNLKSLALRWHLFSEIPESLLELQQLEELDLWCSLGGVKQVPDLTKLPNLKSLLFSGAAAGRTGDPTADASLLDAIGNLPNIETLRLLNWKTWAAIKPCLERLVTLPKLRHLDISSCAVGGIPAAVMSLPTLAELALSSNTPPLDRERYANEYPKLAITYS